MKSSFAKAVLSGALLASAGWANILVNFGTPDAGFTEGVSTTATYTEAGSLQLFAAGFTGTRGSGTPTALYAKTSGGDEVGLGLNNDATDHEITPGNYIQLNLSQLSLYHATTFLLGINSSTGTDAYSIYLSATAGGAETLLASGTAETSYTITAAQFAADPFVTLTATAGNVLLGPGTVVFATPEPGTVLMLGTGLLLVGLRRRLQ